MNKSQIKLNKALEKINDLEMFSDENWDTLHKEMKKINVDCSSGSENLADGFQAFWEIWMNQWELSIDIYNYKQNAPTRFVYFDNYSGGHCTARVNLEEALRIRFVEYLLND